MVTCTGQTFALFSVQLCCSLSIGSTTSTQRLCDLSSAGKFGRGEAEAKLSQGG